MIQAQASNISSQALLVARSHPIGQPIEEYHVSLPLGMKIIAVLVGTLGIAFFALSIPMIATNPVTFLFSIVCIALGIAAFLVPALLKNRIIVLGTEGFVRLKGKQAIVARWDQITVTKRYINRYYVVFICWMALHSYTIQLGDRQKVRLPSFFANVGKLGGYVEEMSTRYQIQQALTTLNSGMPVKFGPLVLSREGIQSGMRRLPWNEIMALRVVNVIAGGIGTGMGNEFLEIKRSGKLLKAAGKTTRIRVSRIENLPTLLALAKQISGGRL